MQGLHLSPVLTILCHTKGFQNSCRSYTYIHTYIYIYTHKLLKQSQLHSSLKTVCAFSQTQGACERHQRLTSRTGIQITFQIFLFSITRLQSLRLYVRFSSVHDSCSIYFQLLNCLNSLPCDLNGFDALVKETRRLFLVDTEWAQKASRQKGRKYCSKYFYSLQDFKDDLFSSDGQPRTGSWEMVRQQMLVIPIQRLPW